MHTYEDYEILVGLLDDAAVRPEKWSRFLTMLSDRSGGTRTHLFGIDSRTGHSIANIEHAYDPAYVESWHGYYNEINSWAARFMDAPIGLVNSTQWMCSDSKLMKSEFYSDWVKPQEDITRGGGVILFRERDRVLAVGGNIRAKDADETEAPFLKLLQKLVPRMQHAFELNRAIHQASTAAMKSGVQLRSNDVALITLTENGKLFGTNLNAVNVLEKSGWAWQSLSGNITFASQRLRDWLASCLDEARQKKSLSKPVVLAGGKLVDAPDYVVRAVAINEKIQSGLQSVFTYVIDTPRLLLVFSPRDIPDTKSPELAKALGLSLAEASIAIGLYNGKLPMEIAEIRGTGLNTVRNQLKSAFSKTGTSSQKDLVALVSQVLR